MKTTKAISLLILIVTLTTLTAGVLASEETGYQVITAEDAGKLIAENTQNPEFIILDVRTDEEYQAGHIANSTNIDYKSSTFKENVDKLDKEKIYVTYCRSGRRSAGASQIMNELGFEKIYMIDGGIVAWEKLGLPTQKAEN